MSEKKPFGGIHGADANPDGRPPTATSRGKPISGLRRTLTKLRKLEHDSLDNIERSVRGESVKRETLASSKWVVSTLATLHRAAIQEEKDLLTIRNYTDPDIVRDIDGVVEKEDEWVPPFSLKRIDKKIDKVEKEEDDDEL